MMALLPYWNLIIAGVLFLLDLYFGLRAGWHAADVLYDCRQARLLRRPPRATDASNR